MNKRFLITGCPRSGTRSAAFWFQSLDFDVGHEVMGKHGTADASFAFDRKGFEFTTEFHLVRNPLRCINSMCDLTRSPAHLALFGFSATKGRDQALFDAVKLWAFINSALKGKGIIIKCEGLPFRSNLHKHECKLTWKKVFEVNPFHAPICFKLARLWDYVPSNSQAPVGDAGA